MRRFFAKPEHISGNRGSLDESESRHLTKVLRLREGDSIEVFDGTGNLYGARIETAGKDGVEFTVDKKIPSFSEPPRRITLLQAVPKARKMDTVIRMTTELGVSRIVPLITERAEVFSDGKLGRERKRWSRIALEACKQSGRTVVPDISPPIEPDRAFKLEASLKLILSENPDICEAMPDDPGHDIMVAVGPEGGWTDGELWLALESGFAALSFGPRILRTETAGISALAVIQYFFGDLSGIGR